MEEFVSYTPSEKAVQADLVSIIICLWNSASVIEQCLESCAAQTYRSFEVIIVDNGSPDNSVDLAAAYSGRLPMTIIRLSTNQGYTGGCNAGLNASSGEFVLLLNSDADLHPAYLENAVGRFRVDAKAATMSGPIYDLTPAGRTTSVQCKGQYIGIYLRFQTYSERQERDGMRVIAPGSPVVMARRSALDDVRLSNGDYYDATLGSYGEDLDLCLRLNARGWDSVYAAKCISWHVGTVSLGGARRVWQKSPSMQRMVVRNKYLVFYGTLPVAVIALESPWFWIGDFVSMMLCAVRQPAALKAFTLAKWDLLHLLPYVWWKRRETRAQRRVGWWPLYSRMLWHRMRCLI
jgi:GT2 family glycosyltransferase